MPNRSTSKNSERAYGLSIYCPIKNEHEGDVSFTSLVRTALQDFKEDEDSPMAKVPNTYLARFFIVDDVIFESFPHTNDHLQSAYLAFSTNFHGYLDEYLTGMYENMNTKIHNVWQYCYGFEKVKDAASFIAYIKKVQVETSYFFVGSNDDSLPEQLKSLYLKQEFSKFVFANQSKSDDELLAAYKEFDARTKPAVLEGPTWRAGAGSLKNVNKG